MNFDIVGSFLAPAKMNIDSGVADIVERQIACGLREATSGELRRKYWNKDFYFGLSGVMVEHVDTGHLYQQDETFEDLLRFTDRVGCNPNHPFYADFDYLNECVAGRVDARQTLPSPTDFYLDVLDMADGDVSRVYPDADNFLTDVATAWRDSLLEFYNHGCRHIQLDDTAFAKMCDNAFVKRVVQGGTDPLRLRRDLITLFNASLDGLPSDLILSLYISSGYHVIPNYGRDASDDGYLLRVLASVDVNAYYLPFEPGDIESLQIMSVVPKGRHVVMGLVDPHSPFPDRPELVLLSARCAQSAYPWLNLSMSPMCGFKLSSYLYRGLTYEDQWRKLEELKALAAKV
jgi:methionine synthase II (cobalamin-independent)